MDIIEDLGTISLAEVKSILRKEEKKREELSYGQKAILTYVKDFKIGEKKSAKILKELKKLDLGRDLECKIVDLLPQNVRELLAITSKVKPNISNKLIGDILKIIKGD